MSGWETAGLIAFVAAWYGVPLYLAATSLPKHIDTAPTTRRVADVPTPRPVRAGRPDTEPEGMSAP